MAKSSENTQNLMKILGYTLAIFVKNSVFLLDLVIFN